MLATELRHDPAARRPLEEAELEQVRLVDVLDRVRFLAQRDGQRREADRPALERGASTAWSPRATDIAPDPLFPTSVMTTIRSTQYSGPRTWAGPISGKPNISAIYEAGLTGGIVDLGLHAFGGVVAPGPNGGK